ncbi:MULTISPECIES: hypothetical protein [unclassified Variovorax]|uniref:hypothetical protein n=1 Tax=unclassified Variovorax TaxID=663243 RepID=UPI0008B07E49|nr:MULTISPECIES: hypothetical protein [unclassified Variovorax]SEJ29363.1 hypothetical protein SAMN05518853_1011244 [Variovorax sp. OK202]SFC23191.1 hypothetical protein SAMN05444746_1011243 [Variovorax sp. OK212]
MIHHELGQWPLVISVSSGLQTLEAMQAFTEDWNRWLDRGEPFASLRVFADADALVHPEGSAQGARQWLQARGADIRRHMMGMASVVPAEQYEKIRKMNVEKLFGVPASTFADADDALVWLGERVMAPRGLPFDLAAVRAAIRSARATCAAAAAAAS